MTNSSVQRKHGCMYLTCPYLRPTDANHDKL